MLMRSLHTAEGTERRPVRRALWPVPAAEPSRDTLYRLFDELYDELRGQWEERFERRYGFWRGFVDELCGGTWTAACLRTDLPGCGARAASRSTCSYSPAQISSIMAVRPGILSSVVIPAPSGSELCNRLT